MAPRSPKLDPNWPRDPQHRTKKALRPTNLALPNLQKPDKTCSFFKVFGGLAQWYIGANLTLNLEPKMVPTPPNLEAKPPNWVPKCPQKAPRCPQDAQFWPKLASTWPQHGSTWPSQTWGVQWGSVGGLNGSWDHLGVKMAPRLVQEATR